MQKEMFIHEDSRRKLIEWANGDFKVAKALIAKAGCVVGDHYHAQKDETFLLLSGRANRVVIGEWRRENVEAPCVFDVPRGTYHLFDLKEGSVLCGVGTAPFDPHDEIEGHPATENR
jgi:mannose-6-phosphate isomerase-like protein (cupin superfamily)